MSVKQEVESAAIATVKCPSCGAEPGEHCHYVGRTLSGQYAFDNLVPTHQRRLSTYVAGNIKETVK